MLPAASGGHVRLTAGEEERLAGVCGMPEVPGVTRDRAELHAAKRMSKMETEGRVPRS